MAIFVYQARDQAGAAQNGQLDAPSRQLAAELLRRRGLILLSLEQRLTGGFSPRSLLPIWRSDVEHGMRQLAVMYRAGMTINEALEALADDAGPRVGRLWRAISTRVREGSSLAEAMATQKHIPPLIVQLVRVGEQSGELDLVLERGAQALERARTLRNSVLAALFYPVIVTTATLCVAAALVFYLIPKLADLLGGLGRNLPWTTRVLVELSHWLVANVVGLGIGVSGTIATIALLYTWPPGRMAIDRLLLRTPIIGGTIRLAGTVQLCRTLSIQVRSGVSMLESLTAIEALLNNRHQQSTMALARARVGAGEPLAPALRDGGGFLPLVHQLVATGERTGSMETVLDHMAEHADDQLQRRIKWLGAIVEPAMIVIVGGMVGFVYYAFFQAVYGAIGGLR